MMANFWDRQEDKPLYPDATWAKPERKTQAGKLLIIGGNSIKFAKTQAAYTQVLELGVGECKVILPRTAASMIGAQHPDIEFVKTTAKGGIGLEAEADLRGFISWADIVLLPGELGGNSETTQLLEHIISSSATKFILAHDAVDSLKHSAKQLLQKPNLTLVLSLAQLQEIARIVKRTTAIRFQMSLIELVEQLHQITTQYPANIAVYFEQNLVTASNGQIVTTRLVREPENWQLQTAALASAWLMWTDPEQALATTAWQLKLRQQ